MTFYSHHYDAPRGSRGTSVAALVLAALLTVLGGGAFDRYFERQVHTVTKAMKGEQK